jgi:hypothetical protein
MEIVATERLDIIVRVPMKCGFGDEEPLKIKGAEVSPQDFLAHWSTET